MCWLWDLGARHINKWCTTSFQRIFWWVYGVLMSIMMLNFLGFSGFSMKFDEDVLKMMKKMKGRKNMKFSMNFWVWSLCEFCFLILVPLILWFSIWNDTSTSSVTSHVAHIILCLPHRHFCNSWWRHGQKLKRLQQKRYREKNQKHVTVYIVKPFYFWYTWIFDSMRILSVLDHLADFVYWILN